MIDGVKIVIDKGDIKNLKRISLNGKGFGGNELENGNEKITTKYRRWKGFKWKETSEVVIVEGSFHTFFNIIQSGENHNHNRFEYGKVEFTLNEFSTLLGVDLKKVRVKRLEIGVNLQLEESPTLYLMKYFHSYKNVRILNYEYLKGKSKKDAYFNTIRLSKHRFKVYDKSKHYKLQDRHILRLEFVDEELTKLNGDKIKIETLDDVLDKKKFYLMSGFLKDYLSKFLLIDPYNIQFIDGLKLSGTEHEREILFELKDPRYFDRLREKCERGLKDKEYRRKKSLAIKTLEKYDLLKENKRFHEMIESEIDVLTNYDTSNMASYKAPVMDLSFIKNLD